MDINDEIQIFPPSLAKFCPHLERLEFRWDNDTLRYLNWTCAYVHYHIKHGFICFFQVFRQKPKGNWPPQDQMFEAEVHGEFRIENHASDKSTFSRVCAMGSFTRSCVETLNEPTEQASSEQQSIARLVFTLELSSKLFIRSPSTTCLLIMRSYSLDRTSKSKTTLRWGLSLSFFLWFLT